MFKVSAPGKIILHGEHSVVYGKLALAASLGLRTQLTLHEHQSQDCVTLDLRAVNLTRSFRLEDLRSRLLSEPSDDALLLERIDRYLNSQSDCVSLSQTQNQAVTSTLYLIATILNEDEVGPFTLSVTTELTVSSGLGSSASFLVVVAAAFLLYKRSDTKITSFGDADLESISKWAFAAEKIIHGTPSGLDNTICTYGSVVEFRKGTAPKPLELPCKLRALLVNTKIPKDTKALIAKVVSLRGKFPGTVDRVLEAMDEVARAALKSLSDLDYEAIGVLSDVNQNLLRALGVSHPALDTVCRVLSEEGLHGKLTGAGGGGYAICIVPPTFDEVALDKVVHKLISLGFEAILTDLGGPGVTIT